MKAGSGTYGTVLSHPTRLFGKNQSRCPSFPILFAGIIRVHGVAGAGYFETAGDRASHEQCLGAAVDRRLA